MSGNAGGCGIGTDILTSMNKEMSEFWSQAAGMGIFRGLYQESITWSGKLNITADDSLNICYQCYACIVRSVHSTIGRNLDPRLIC